MEEMRDRARLVEADAFAGRPVTATVPRSEIEDILRSEEGSPELELSIVRRDGDAQQQTLRLDWDPKELEELLRRTEGQDVTLMFDEPELERALADIDVEAHGLRERALVLAVATTTAAAAAGSARAVPLLIEDSSGSGSGAPIEMISDAATSGVAASPELVSDAALSGPGALATAAESPELISDAALSGPGPVASAAESPELVSDAALSGPPPAEPAELASSGGTGISAPSPETTGAIVGGVALALTAAFAVRRRRSHDDAARPA